MIIPETAIGISTERYTELIRAERDADYLKEYLSAKLKSYGGVSHSELETLCAVGVIRRDNNVSDT